MSLRINDIKLPLDHAEAELKKSVLDTLGITADELLAVNVYKRAYDARKKSAICLIYNLDVVLNPDAEKKVLAALAGTGKVLPSPDTTYKFVAKANADFPSPEQQRPIIIGFGPCGILTALVLAQMGLKPIVLERGQDVRIRTQDTWGLWRKSTLNTESNVQFGEGGAGTFSDGKLYSQIKDKFHYGRKVLTEFVKAGAPEEILYVSKPHIGTFKLVTMVEKMRAEIIALGGEIRFGQRVEKLHIDNGQAVGVTLASGETLQSRHVVMAIGHSARDTFQMLFDAGV
ncbi:MAG: FAD-dependent oxidoreductase, partial [Arenimonas sp.]